MNPNPRHRLPRRSLGTTGSTRTDFTSTAHRLQPEDITCDSRTPPNSYAKRLRYLARAYSEDMVLAVSPLAIGVQLLHRPGLARYLNPHVLI